MTIPEPDFSREQSILNLAVKLELGDATREEMKEAADALSRAAGERIGLEHRLRGLETALAFFMRVMKRFDFDSDIDDYLSWSVLQAPFGSPIRFYISYSNEEITPDNLPALEQAFTDVAACGDEVSSFWALALFTARAGTKKPSEELLRQAPPAVGRLLRELT